MLAFAIQFYGFQTYLAHKVAAYMSEELKAEVSIDALEIDLIKRVELKGLLIRDLKGDTLIYAPKVKCNLSNYSIHKRFVTLSEISLVEPRIKLAKYKGEKDLNFEFIQDYFDDGKKDPNKKSNPWQVNVQRIKVERANFTMNNFNKPYDEFGVDFDHLGLYPLNVSLSSFSNFGDTSSFLVKNMAFKERSGLVIDTLNTRVKITPTSLTFTPLNMHTPYTVLRSPYLSFGYNDFDDFDDFEEKVVLSTYVLHTKLNLGDLSYFVHELKGSRQEIFLNGKFNGTVDNFATEDLTVAYSPHTSINGNFKVRNITRIDDAYFDLDVKKLEMAGNEIRFIQLPPYDGKSFLVLPDEVYRMGNIEYAGTFKGTLYDFESKGGLVSTAGNVTEDITYHKVRGKKNYVIEGNVKTTDLEAGTILAESILGKVTGEFTAKVSGTDFDRNMQVKIDSKIESIGFNDYTYHNTTVVGNIRNRTFSGKVNIQDPNATIAYDGYFDYGKKIPRYRFDATIKNAAITKLNFGNRDESAMLSLRISTNGRGLKADDLSGRIDINDVRFAEKGKVYKTDSISVKAEDSVEIEGHLGKRLTLKSEVADVEISDQFNFAELPSVFNYVLSKAVPSMFDNQVVEVGSREVFRYKVNIKDFSKIQQLFVPDLELSKNTMIDGRFDSEKNIFRLGTRNIKRLKYGDREFDNLKVSAKNNDDYLDIELTADYVKLNDSVSLEQFVLITEAFDNDFGSSIRWNNKSGNYGFIATRGEVISHNEFAFTLDTVRIQAQGHLWETTKQALVQIDSTTITVEDLVATSGAQSIAVEGGISKDPDTKLVVNLNNFRLETITPLIFGSDINLRGKVNGDLAISEVYDVPNFVNKITIDSFYVNKDWVGDVKADNFYEKGSDMIVTNAQIVRKGMKTLDVTGQYYLSREKNSLDYTMHFREANLNFVNAFLPQDVVKNFQSIATGDIHLTGTPKEPDFNGKLNIKDGSIKIVLLNTSYFLEDGEIEVTNDMIALNRMTIMDVRGNGGKVNGTYYHKNFKDGNYSFDLEFKKMLCLNTTEEMNDLYFGKAYASGAVSIQGYGGNIDVVIDAKTEKNTKLTLPMYGVSDVTLGDFVVFVNEDSALAPEKKIDLSGITLTFDLNVTPDAEINIVFDKLTGQQLKAHGRGPIKMEITPYGDFVMNGVYEIEDPSTYKLAMQSIVNKNFVVAKGGTIKWYGDPLNAEVDITAVYKLQASVFDIMPVDIQNNYRKNMEVDVKIELKNSLYRPDFVFDFIVPKGDENVKSAVASVKSTREELFRQTMALLIVNKFLTPSNSIGTAATSGSGAANYTSELITNQLNSLLSQISKDFDIGVNYKPGDQISNQEIALALSTQILNGRLNLSGNFGMSKSPAAAAQSQNNVIGDFNLEYLLSEDGNVRLRAYNESNAFDITKLQQSPYTQGMGIFYQKEFDTAKELRLLQNFLNIFRPASKDVHLPRKTRAQRRAEKAARKKANQEAKKEAEKLESNPDALMEGNQ